MMKRLTQLGLLALFFYACTNTDKPTAVQEPEAATWISLFDGSSTAQWRAYNADTFPSGWRIEEDMLVVAKGGGDLITKQQFENFELMLEVQLTDTANSGILYRVLEQPNTPIWHNAPEYQLLDNAFYTQEMGAEVMETHLMGDNYDLQASEADYAKPTGEWNTVKLLINNGKVEHWLNGHQTVVYDFNSADWAERVAASKFKNFEGFGKTKLGHIGLQEHNYEVRFRNIRIREL